MKKSLLFKSVVALILLLTAAAPPAVAQQSDQHMLWQIESEGEVQGYLVGSVHLMKPEIYPLDDVYQNAFNQSEVLVFELNFDSVMVKMAPLVQKMAIYSPGESVKGVLSEETYTLLQATLDSLGLPAARFNRMEPWLLAITIPSAQIRQAGYTGVAGIDMHFFNKAKQAGKEVAGLETAAYQLGLFDDLSPELQERYLKYSLKEADQTIARIDEMVTAWQQGNAQMIESMMQAEMKEDFPKLYNKLLNERNYNWFPKIEALLAKEETPMIVVGAGHIVGQNGLVSLLKEQGYEVEQL